MVQCKHCKRNITLMNATARTFYDGKRSLTHYFCGQTCLEQWYIGQLSMLGL